MCGVSRHPFPYAGKQLLSGQSTLSMVTLRSVMHEAQASDHPKRSLTSGR